MIFEDKNYWTPQTLGLEDEFPVRFRPACYFSLWIYNGNKHGEFPGNFETAQQKRAGPCYFFGTRPLLLVLTLNIAHTGRTSEWGHLITAWTIYLFQGDYLKFKQGVWCKVGPYISITIPFIGVIKTPVIYPFIKPFWGLVSPFVTI